MDSSMTGGFDANIAFIVCLVLGILFLVLAVLFFFVFDIPNVYLIRTGKGARKTIRKMEEINAETGRLRRNKEEYTLNSDVPITGEMGNTPSYPLHNQGQHQPAQQYQQPAQSQSPQQVNGTQVLSHVNETEVLSYSQPAPQQNDVQYPERGSGDGNNLTTVLGPSETTLLRNSETTVLSQDMLNNTASQYVYRRQTTGRFVVTYNLMLVHSNEII